MLRKLATAIAALFVVVAVIKYFQYFDAPQSAGTFAEIPSSESNLEHSIVAPAAVTSAVEPSAVLQAESPIRDRDGVPVERVGEPVATSTALSSDGIDALVTESPVTLSGLSASELGLDLYAIARQGMSDAEFENLTVLIAENPLLQDELFNEFRYETDSERLAKLSQLLGQFNSEKVAVVAGEMVYSGNENSQRAALDLLRQTQGENPQARDVLIDLLAIESDSDVLSVALNAVTTRHQATDLQAQTVISNVSSLVQHEDPIVRARSLAVLSQWTKDEQATPVLLAGLSDSDPRVRQKAAYSFLDYPYVDNNVIAELLAVAENTAERGRTRKAALLALGKMRLSTEQRKRARAASDDANRVTTR